MATGDGVERFGTGDGVEKSVGLDFIEMLLVVS